MLGGGWVGVGWGVGGLRWLVYVRRYRVKVRVGRGGQGGIGSG